MFTQNITFVYESVHQFLPKYKSHNQALPEILEKIKNKNMKDSVEGIFVYSMDVAPVNNKSGGL